MNKKEVKAINDHMAYLRNELASAVLTYNVLDKSQKLVTARIPVISANVALNTLVQAVDLLGSPKVPRSTKVRLLCRESHTGEWLTVFPNGLDTGRGG